MERLYRARDYNDVVHQYEKRCKLFYTQRLTLTITNGRRSLFNSED
ncbi:MAG: hypothetical protein F6K23_01140 [Okeania sp. SIO2C9]|nr:hypothetical protein [Okeania sp. SIO2C9]NEQ71808.1 hypothetical protein [Okeania sp. SIO2C9]